MTLTEDPDGDPVYAYKKYFVNFEEKDGGIFIEDIYWSSKYGKQYYCYIDKLIEK